MTPTLLYLIGPPGAGKTTLMAALTKGLNRRTTEQPFAHDWLADPTTAEIVAVELGRRRQHFSGTDALALNANPKACQWITTRPVPLVLGEGDRLANARFLNTATRAGYQVNLVHVDADEPTLTRRRTERGSTQNPAWIQGRVTKAHRLAEQADREGWRLIPLDARDATPEQLTAHLTDTVPTLATLAPERARR